MIETAAMHAKANVEQTRQYSLARILSIWALAALPMGALGWIVFPAIAPGFAADPSITSSTRK